MLYNLLGVSLTILNLQMSIKFHGFKKYHTNVIISEEISMTRRFRFRNGSTTRPCMMSEGLPRRIGFIEGSGSRRIRLPFTETEHTE